MRAAPRSRGADADPAFAAEALALPGEAFLADQMTIVDVDAIHAARDAARGAIGRALHERLARDLRRGWPIPDRIGSTAPRSGGGRCATPASPIWWPPATPRACALAKAQFDAGRNMTDVLAALSMLADVDCPERRGSARRVPRALARRRAGARQVVRDPGDVAAARHRRGGAGACRACRFRPAQSEPGARAGRQLLRRQPGAVP